MSQVLKSLNVLYNEIPKTSGCEDCSFHYGDNIDWCCKSLNPSMYYVEFWNAWLEVKNNWPTQQRKSLILRAIKNYLSNSTSKGCIFYDGGCTIYKKRPLSCRLYGVLPKEVWQSRVKSLKERYGEEFEVKNQCHIVKSNKKITADDEQSWFEQTIALEKELQIPEEVVDAHDLPGGSYRTFHDHLLLEIFPPEYLELLTKFRLEDPSKEDIDLTVEEISKQLNNMVV